MHQSPRYDSHQRLRISASFSITAVPWPLPHSGSRGLILMSFQVTSAMTLECRLLLPKQHDCFLLSSPEMMFLLVAVVLGHTKAWDPTVSLPSTGTIWDRSLVSDSQ